jgi:hypothetical protein
MNDASRAQRPDDELPSIPLTFRAPVAEVRWLRDQAREHGTSVSKLVRAALADARQKAGN